MGLRGIGSRPLSDREGELIPPGGMPWEAEDLTRSGRVIAFCETLTISSGGLAGSRMQLRDFQRQFIADVYQEKDGGRPVRTAVLSLGRKNGKTQLAAALALCHLCGPESESRGEVYSCANDRAQAAKIFHEMVALIVRLPWLSARCNIIRHSKQIEDMVNGSVYVALSSEAKTKMGLSPSFVIYDELGSAPNRELYDAMDSALGARKEPLLLVISTQAADDLAPMSTLIDYGLRVQAGEIEDAGFHLSLYRAPEDADPWKKKSWEAANPALGDFRSLEDVQRLARQAQRMPSMENSFRNLILNQRVAAEARFIERSAWEACGGKAEIPDGVPVYAGLDLGATRDMSALALVYQDTSDKFHVKLLYWLPGAVKERAEQDRVPYDVWAKQNLIMVGGEATDPRAVARKIAEINGRNRIKSLAFDRWKIHELKRELEHIGCTVPLKEHGQGFKDMSPAVDVLERLIVQRRLRHGKNPVLTWNANNAVVVRDPAGSRKLDKARSIGRIDGLIALAMALGTALMRTEVEFDVRALIG